MKRTKSQVVVVVAGLLLVALALFYSQNQKSKTLDPSNIIGKIVTKTPGTGETRAPTGTVTTDLHKGKIVDLSGKGLTEVPADLIKNTSLVELNLTNNSVTSLPSQIQAWTSLEIFKIANNKLTSLPGEIRFFSKLRTLDASNNSLTGLPAELGQLSNLRDLDLSDNKITEFPNEILKLTGLKTLDIRGNPVTPAHLKLLQDSLVNTEIQF